MGSAEVGVRAESGSQNLWGLSQVAEPSAVRGTARHVWRGHPGEAVRGPELGQQRSLTHQGSLCSALGRGERSFASRQSGLQTQAPR